jgi:RNA polymerase sigma factor (sigma-70 family)
VCRWWRKCLGRAKRTKRDPDWSVLSPRGTGVSVLRLLRDAGAAPSPTVRSAEQTDPLRVLAFQAAKGDRHAERTLLIALGPSVLRAVRSVLGADHPDVEDVLQQAMVGVHLALQSFRAECSVRHFASRIAAQTALNARRRAGYRTRHTPNLPPETLAEVPCSEDSPAESLAASRRRATLRQLLCELPDVQAEVLALHTMLGYSVGETAAAVGAPVNTVRSRLRSALAALRARVEGDCALLDAIVGAL